MLHCHGCLTEWAMNGSHYDTLNRMRCTTPADAEDKQWVQPAATILDGEALCIYHLKNRWANILDKFDLADRAYLYGQ